MNKFEFNFKTNMFDLKNSLRLAEASALAYESERKIKEHVKNKWGFDKFKFFNKKDTQAFMIASDDIMILTFRGTESIQDWLTDFDAKLIKGPFGKAHRGFLQALNDVLSSIKKTIAGFCCEGQSFWITGHSLGGALAALSAAYFVERKLKIDGLYTYGQPRIGDKEFATNFDLKFKRRYFRFLNNEDIVTRVPPRALGYADVGNVLYFDSFGMMHKGIKWWQGFLDISFSNIVRASNRFNSLQKQFPNGIEDHSLDIYIERIKANISK